MKVSIIACDLSSNSLVRVYPIARTLARHFDVEVLGTCSRGEIFKPYQDEFDYKVIRGSLYLPGLYRTLCRLRDSASGDVVYAFKPRVTSYLPALMKRLRDRTPVVLDIEDWEYALATHRRIRSLASSVALWHPNSLTYVVLVERLARLANTRIVATRWLQRRFGGLYVPHGVDTATFDPAIHDGGAIRRRFGINDEILVMFAGTPHSHKGLRELVSAVETANRSGVRLRLMIVGGDRESTDVQRLDQSPGTIVLGYQPHQAMPEFLAAADIVALPQVKSPIAEAQVPGKVFEAMAMEKSIVATAVGDLPEILRDCGLIVRPNDPKALADALVLLASERSYARRVGTKARAKCIREYSWDAMEAPLLEAFVSLGRLARETE